MSHNFGHSFSPVCLLFSKPSPNGEHRVDYSVYCVEIARSLARTSFDLVLQEIDVQSPMHAFDGPMLAYDVWIAAVLQYGAAFGLTIHADYLHAAVLQQFVVVCLCKRLHPVGQGRLVHPVFNATQRRLRWHTIPKHAHLAESVEIMPAKFYYIILEYENMF